jgi:hypothetical protein
MAWGGRGSRSLGERLSTSVLLILLGALASTVGIYAFATGKTLPDLLGKGPGHTRSANSPSAGPSPTRPTTRHTAVARSSHKPATVRPTAKTSALSPPITSSPLPSTCAPVANPVVNGLAAPSAAEIESCIKQRAIDANLADYGLNDSNLGKPATLQIEVGAGDYTYQLIAADNSCQPTTLATVYPGESATVHLYFGAMWDFDYPGEKWDPAGPSPIGPENLNTYIFEQQTATVTVTAG